VHQVGNQYIDNTVCVIRCMPWRRTCWWVSNPPHRNQSSFSTSP